MSTTNTEIQKATNTVIMASITKNGQPKELQAAADTFDTVETPDFITGFFGIIVDLVCKSYSNSRAKGVLEITKAICNNGFGSPTLGSIIRERIAEAIKNEKTLLIATLENISKKGSLIDDLNWVAIDGAGEVDETVLTVIARSQKPKKQKAA